MKALIVAHGGKNSGSISSRTSYLLAGDQPGPEKLKKAEALGVEIINESRFMEITGHAENIKEEDNQLTLF